MEKKLEPKTGAAALNKLSYEELENVCHQLSAQAQQLNTQNQQLRMALNEANLANLYKRLDYLFEVINKDNPYLSVDFKRQCADEIETLMATPEQPENTPEVDKEDLWSRWQQKVKKPMWYLWIRREPEVMKDSYLLL